MLYKCCYKCCYTLSAHEPPHKNTSHDITKIKPPTGYTKSNRHAEINATNTSHDIKHKSSHKIHKHIYIYMKNSHP